MRRAVYSIVILSSWSVSFSSAAGSIHAYKSVHADGIVSYSDTRPDSASSVTSVSIPGTDPATVEQGQKRRQEMESIARDLEQQREEQSKVRRAYASRRAEAQREVAAAERSLASVYQSKHNATQERIELAEETLRLARQRLREVEKAGP